MNAALPGAPTLDLGSRRRRARRDLLAIVITSVATYASAASVGLFERVQAFLIRHDRWEVDEIIFAVLTTAIGFSIFAARRWSDFREAYGELAASHRRLVFAEKMASVGRLTAGLAHEMNTPLGTARSSLVRLQALAGEYRASIGDPTVGPEDHQEIAAEMEAAVELATRGLERAATFVRSLRSQTRVRDDEPVARFDAVAVVREALLLIGHHVRRVGCEVAFTPEFQQVEIQGSAGQLSQVVTNLVQNAADAAPGTAIGLRLEPQPGAVLLVVEDHGTGIAAHDLPHIFEPFFTTKPVNEGTGLGLSLVHEIVTKAFGGSIAVNTEVGRGTTISIRFPSREEIRHGT